MLKRLLSLCAKGLVLHHFRPAKSVAFPPILLVSTGRIVSSYEAVKALRSRGWVVVGVFLDIAPLLIAFLAFIVSVLSLRTASQANKSTVFDQRFEIYSDVEKFLRIWLRDGNPDMTELPTLVHAWSRSHFLCSRDTTNYLRKLWLDSLRADYLKMVISGEIEGDHSKAVLEFNALSNEHIDPDRLRGHFMRDLKV